jgi:hypothetical protein
MRREEKGDPQECIGAVSSWILHVEKTAKHYLAHLHVACVEVWLTDVLPAA